MRLVLMVLLAMTSSALSAERVPTFPKRTSYEEARESLIALGWQPAPTSANPNRCSPGFEERCKSYPEATACSGTGLARCTFLWRSKSGETLIEVGTFGEEDPPMVERVRCRVGCRR